MSLLLVGWASEAERVGGVESIQTDMARLLGARFVGVAEAAAALGVELGPYDRHGNIDRCCILAEYVSMLETTHRFSAIVASADTAAFLRTRAPLITYWHNPYRDVARAMRARGFYDRRRWYEYGEQYPALQTLAGHHAARNVAVSPWMMGYIRRCGLTCDRVIPLGVDADFFHPARIERDRVRQRLYLDLDAKIVLFVGAFHPVSGYALVQDLVRRDPDLNWVLVFKEPRSEKTRFVGTDDVPYPCSSKNVRVLENVPRSTMVDLYRAADVLLSPAPVESFNLKAVEALATGLPVVVGRTGTFADWPAEGPFGSVVDSGGPEDFLAAVHGVLGERTGGDPRSTVVPYFTLPRFQQDWTNLLEGLPDVRRAEAVARPDRSGRMPPRPRPDLTAIQA